MQRTQLLRRFGFGLATVVFRLSLNVFGFLLFLTHVWAPFLPDGWGFLALWIPVWPTLHAVAKHCPGEGQMGKFCTSTGVGAAALVLIVLSFIAKTYLEPRDHDSTTNARR